jgi:RNA polymerase sigma-70 factor (ECF subfamily)
VVPDEEKTDRARLMERARGGDREAFCVLFKDVGPMITRFLRRRLSDSAELEDICQETLIAVYKSRHTYQPARPFEPWLFAIARKVAGEHLRRDRERRGFQVQLPELPEFAVEGPGAFDIELREALEQLSPSQLEALRLTKLSGLSVAEAARRTGATAGSIKVRVHRAYESLRKSLVR